MALADFLKKTVLMRATEEERERGKKKEEDSPFIHNVSTQVLYDRRDINLTLTGCG